PTPRRIVLLPFLGHLLFAFPANVARVVVLLNRRLTCGIVIGFIQAQVLPLPGGWLRPLNHAGFNRRIKQFGINPIGRGDNNRERPATPLQREGYVSCHLWPDRSDSDPPRHHPRALFPGPYQRLASTNQPHPVLHIPQSTAPRSFQTTRSAPIAERCDEGLSHPHRHAGWGST